MKLQPLDAKPEPRYPHRDDSPPGRSVSWKRAAAALGASLALWAPACDGSDGTLLRTAGAMEPVRLGGDEPAVVMPTTDPLKPPEVHPDEVRPAGAVRPPQPPDTQIRMSGQAQVITPPQPPPPPPDTSIRMPGRAPIVTPLPGTTNTDPIKPPVVQTPPPAERPDRIRMPGVPRRVEQ